jgi:hypothetical protein
MSIRDLIQRMSRPQLLILLTASILILVWFRKGLMLATGENAIIFDRTPRLLEMVTNSWGDVSLGGPNISVASTIPFYLVVSLMVNIGIPGVLIQALLFWLLLVSGSLSIFYIVREFVKDDRRDLAATIAGLFYMLNPYTMIGIWNRFQYTYMFFYAFMPFILLLFIKGLELRRLKYALYIGLASLLIAYSYGSVPLIGTFWLVIISYTMFYIISNIRRPRIVLFTLAFSALTFIIWLAVNSWWLVLFISLASPEYAAGGPIIRGELIALEVSKSILISTSKELGGLINLFRLVHIKFLKDMVNIWGPIYFSWEFIVISFLIPILTFAALLFKPRYKLTFYFVILSILGLFLTKGTAPPLGELFLKVFESSSIFIVYRNPFEKLGIVLPLAFAPLFGLSISSIYHWLRKHVQILLDGKRIDPPVMKIVTLLLCSLILVTYVWPMWSGYVFTSSLQPANNPEIGYFTNIPEYYKEANKWLSVNAHGYRAIFLPLAPIGMTYKWGYGYSGVELVDQLFDTEVVGMHIGLKLYDEMLWRIENVLLSTTKFWKLMNVMNAKYIIVRSDIDYEMRGVKSPEDIKRALNYTIEPSIINGSVEISSISVKSLIDRYDLKDWHMIWYLGDYSLSLDSDAMQSNSSIKVVSGNSGLAIMPEKDYTLNLIYNLPEDKRNLSNAKYLLIWIKSSVPGVLWISISDGDKSLNYWGVWQLRGWNGDPRYTIRNEEVDMWKLLILPLDIPTYIYKGKPDLSSIKSISIVLFTDRNSTRQEYLKISGIFADSGKIIKVEGINYVISFGKLDVYELDEKFLLPRIFAVSKSTIANDINDFLFNLIPSEDYDPRYEAVVLKEHLNDESRAILEMLNPDAPPKIEFVKINPAIWQVNVFNATSPFLLIFSEAYHPMWKAYYGEVSWVSALQIDSIPDKYHFIVNGYANAWYIDKTGTYTITLYFKPQSFLVIGSIISALSIIISILGIIYVEHDRFAKFLKTLFTLAQHLKFLSFNHDIQFSQQ